MSILGKKVEISLCTCSAALRSCMSWLNVYYTAHLQNIRLATDARVMYHSPTGYLVTLRGIITVTSTASAKKCLITKRDMHKYTGQCQSTVQLEPAQARMGTYRYMQDIKNILSEKVSGI